MRNLIKRILNFALDTCRFVLFLLQKLFTGRHPFAYKGRIEKTISLLANAPSLKEVLPRLQTDSEFQDVEFIVLNFFAFDPVFFSIKPKHYCFADPMFFRKNHRYEDVRRLYGILQSKVDWDMNIYVSSNQIKDFISFSGLSNPSLHITPINTLGYQGYSRLRNFFYRKGWAMPPIATVANMAIFIGINAGYSHIRLYGVDHSFFNGICVNENNELCTLERHFYDTESRMKPIVRNDNNQVFKTSEYVQSIANMFSSHDLLANYALYMGTSILNCTTCSLIDSYPRKA